MGSITKRGEKWRAEVRRKGHKAQCKTFASKALAERWVRSVESAIDSGATPAESASVRVRDVVLAYRQLREQARPISDSSTEHYTIKHLEDGLGHLLVAKITVDDIVAYATMRREEGAGPYTINCDLSKLGTVLKFGGVALKVTLPDIVGAARPMLSHLRLIGGGGKRERRPTEDELRVLIEHLQREHGQLYADVVRFAVWTAMRRGEITRLTWSDLDEAKRLVLIRDRKHPRKKIGNNEWVPLLGEAWDLVQRQAKDDERIFPVHEQTLSKYFKAACDALGIPDLHFHDLRHEGTSRLFEQGYAIEQVALVTGHKDWRHLKRYTNLRPEDLHR